MLYSNTSINFNKERSITDETEIKNYSGKLEYFTKIAIPT